MTRSAAPATLTAVERRSYERNLRKFYLFSFLTDFQLWLPIWVAFLIIRRDLSLTEIAILDAPFWLLVVFAEVPTGAVADRWGRSVSLWSGAILNAFALVAFAFAPSLGWIMGSYLLWAVALTLFSGADSALLYDSLKTLGREREYEKFAGRAMAGRSFGLVLAFLMGGPVAEALGLQAPLFFGAGVTLLAGAVAMSFKEPPRLDSGPQLSYLQGVRAALRTVWEIPTVRTLIPFAAVIMASTMATEYLTQPFLLSHDVDVGFAFSGLQVPIRAAGIVGALVAFWFVTKLGEPRLLLMLPVIGVGAYAGIALWDALGAIGFLAVLGLVRAAAFPVVTGYINRRVPSDQRATILSLNQVAFSLLLAPLVPALGISADKIDIPTGFAVAGIILAVLAALTGWFWLRAHRSESATPPGASLVPSVSAEVRPAPPTPAADSPQPDPAAD